MEKIKGNFDLLELIESWVADPLGTSGIDMSELEFSCPQCNKWSDLSHPKWLYDIINACCICPICKSKIKRSEKIPGRLKKEFENKQP